ncbi:regucalcin-like [Periplaneta americana]|uniref:regucalcin-like n=1 Tax=Periplaneta americana TaxID=6978 RepID=UPI0037E8205E
MVQLMRSIVITFLFEIMALRVCQCCIRRVHPEPTVTQVTSPVMHGEGPHWDIETQTLLFVDIAGKLVNRYDPATKRVTHAKLGGAVSIVIPLNGSNSQKFITTRGHDIVLLNWNHENATFDTETNGHNVTVITSVETKMCGNRWNDGKADAMGRLWAGTIGPEPQVGHVLPLRASFYLLDRNDTYASAQVKNVSISNGLVWNEDSSLLYYIDTATYQVDVFDYDMELGKIYNRRKVFNLRENGIAGFPDGMTMDNKGTLWVACFNGGQVINIDPVSGSFIRKVAIPASRVTSVMFGGPNLDVLYVTTSRYQLTEEELAEQPLAGSVFAVRGLGVRALKPAYNVVRIE